MLLGDLSMTDTISAAIQSGSLCPENISFDLIRYFASHDYGSNCWDRLGRGRAILKTVEELDQYLHSYGPMTRSQWDILLREWSFTPEPTQIIDYGCGQGLATALLFDRFGKDLIDSVQKVVLIEPSPIALARAAKIVTCYSKSINVVAINKTLEEVTAEELKCEGDVHGAHLFSNVLDIDDYEPRELFGKMFQSKTAHSVLAVSPDRDFEGGTERFRELEKAVKDQKHKDWLTVSGSQIKKWQCQNDKESISWIFQAEVKSGPF